MSIVVGLFVGGAGKRMGGVAKGRLLVAGEPILSRTARIVRALGLDLALVGDARDYGDLVPDAPRIADDPPGIGPLGGLAALLAHAGSSRAITLACDMPSVTEDDLRALAAYPSERDVVAARRDGFWEPLFARFDPRVLPVVRRAIARDTRSFQALFAELDVEPFTVRSQSTLIDWDRPEDVSTS